DCIVSGVGSRAGHNGHPARCHFDGGIDYLQPLVVRKSWRLASSAAGNQEVDSGFHLPGYEVPQCGVINGAILMKRGYEGGAASTKLHAIKITLSALQCREK